MRENAVVRRVAPWAGVVLFGVAYYALAKLSLTLVAEPEKVSVLWPASGLALGVIACCRMRWWPALAGAVLVASVLAESLARGASGTSLGLAVVNAAEPVLAAVVLLAIAGRGNPLAYGSIRSVGGLVAAATVANGVTAAAAAGLLAAGAGAPFGSAWATWWIADGLGMVSVAPVIFALHERERRPYRASEVVLIGVMLVVSLALVWQPAAEAPAYLRSYVIFPLLAWTAIRSGPRTTAISTLIVFVLFTFATAHGSGPFVRPDFTHLESVKAVQGYLAAAAFVALILGGALSERLGIEWRLDTSRRHLTSMLNAATEIAIIGCDTNGRIDLFNVGAERMLGYTADEMLGRTPADIHEPAEVADRARELGIPPGVGVLVHAALRGEAETREWTYIRSDGAAVRVSLTVTARRDGAGRLLGFVGIARDVSDNARLEAERSALVRVSRAVAADDDTDHERLWNLVTREVAGLHRARVAAIVRFEEDGAGAIAGVWTDGGWLSVGAAVDLVADTASGLVRRTGRAVRTASDEATGPGIGAPVIVNGRLWGALTMASGAERPFPPDAETGLGRFADLVGLAIANAEHREALQRGREELSTIIDGLPAMVWVRDADGRLLLANRAFSNVRSAASAGTADGRATLALLDSALDGAALGKATTTWVEQEVDDGHGGARTYLVARSPLVDRRGRPYAVCGVATDITERREAERAKDEFVSVVSHELRTPLSSIRGALALIADEGEALAPASRDRMIAIALSNSERLTTLINDILDLQRITTGATMLELRACDAGALAREAAEAMGSFAIEHGVEIRAVPGEAPVTADADRIMQVLNNLLSNAVKFSEPGGHVQVGAIVRDDEVRLFVRDEGRGIPADKLETIFGRFEQVDSSDSRRVGGTGLGLAICRELAAQHGGRIWAESRLGHGSCFWLALPHVVAPEGPGEVDPRRSPNLISALAPVDT